MNTPELNNQTRPRVAILGVTGMIGSAVYDVLKDYCELVVTYRNPEKLEKLYQCFGRPTELTTIQFDFSALEEDYKQGFAGTTLGPNAQKLFGQLGQIDWVINAMGVTKALADDNPSSTLFLNGAVPHILASMFGDKLIHITTDCVFDGVKGAPYDENSPKHPTDLYGLSKSIGEPTTALVLRTSTIGLELGTKYGLLEWFMSQTGQVNGFTNHLWNGITTHELGRICLKLITGSVAHPGAGVYHVCSSDITKAELLQAFRAVTGKHIEITPITAPITIDRRLATIKSLCQKLSLSSFGGMLSEVLASHLPEEVL